MTYHLPVAWEETCRADMSQASQDSIVMWDSSPHPVSGRVTRTPIAKAKHCSVYDTFPPTFSSENFCNSEKSARMLQSTFIYSPPRF